MKRNAIATVIATAKQADAALKTSQTKEDAIAIAGQMRTNRAPDVVRKCGFGRFS